MATARKPTVRRRRPRSDFSVAVQRAIAEFDRDTKGGDVEVVRVITLVNELAGAIKTEAGEMGRDVVHNTVDDTIDHVAKAGADWFRGVLGRAAERVAGKVK